MMSRIEDDMQHAARLRHAGRVAEAESACRSILSEYPDHVDALNLLGIIAGQTDRFEEAADCFQKALIHAPNRAAIMSNLAEALRLQGRLAEALPLFQRAVSIAPENKAGYLKLIAVLMDLGRPDEALSACRTGLLHHPNETNLHGLATDLLLQQQRPGEAVAHLRIALKQAPELDSHWIRLYRLLLTGHLLPDQGRPWLLKVLAHPAIRPDRISESIAKTLCLDSNISRLINLAERGDLPRGSALAEALSILGSDELLVALMEISVIPSPPLERLFTGLRRSLLQDMPGQVFSPAALRFCTALAIQAFHTDYAWFVTGEEEALVERQSARLSDGLGAEPVSDLQLKALAVLGCYRPLYRMDRAVELAQRSWPASFATLIRVQIREPIEERELRAQIPRITPIMDTVSRQVQAQYEENPYPRWVRAERAPRAPIHKILHSFGAVIPADPSFTSPEVLIAGCGTGLQSVIAALFYENAKIVAIDLSLTSLAYALRKSRELGIDNIEHLQGDIMELGRLGQKFHVIESIGVLHHLADPVAGWRILVDLLRPGGIMNIGLYSETARSGIVMAHDHIAEKGYAATTADIRQCRRDIFDSPDDHPLASLRLLRDLYSISDCRDLLFHVQEHRFTLLRIKQVLNDLGLKFLRLDTGNTNAYRARFPDDPRMTSLDNWHVFEQENPDAFREMYQFWVQKVKGVSTL